MSEGRWTRLVVEVEGAWVGVEADAAAAAAAAVRMEEMRGLACSKVRVWRARRAWRNARWLLP